MDKRNTPRLRKGILLIVCSTAIVFLTGGVWLGAWSARSMRESVVEQFNEEQLVIAHSVASLIERDLGFLKKEIYLLRKEISAGDLGQEAQDKAIQSCFSRVLENGVWKIEIIDLHNSVTHSYTPYRHWSVKGPPGSGSTELPPSKTSAAILSGSRSHRQKNPE